LQPWTARNISGDNAGRRGRGDWRRRKEGGERGKKEGERGHSAATHSPRVAETMPVHSTYGAKQMD